MQERWNDYEEYYGSLVKWLADMENTLGMDPEPKAQLVEKKTQLDKYKVRNSLISVMQFIFIDIKFSLCFFIKGKFYVHSSTPTTYTDL